MNLEEIKSFIQTQINYTEFTQEGITLEIVFNRDKGMSVVILTLSDGMVKVVETYESRELGGTISKVRRFKSFKRLQNFLLLFNGK